MIRRLWRRVRRALTLRRVLKWSLVGLLVATLLLLSPVAYVELRVPRRGRDADLRSRSSPTPPFSAGKPTPT